MDDPGVVAILCGGRGTRLRRDGESMPKALVDVGGRPILWHVLGIYAAQGFSRFVLLTGYQGDRIEAWATAEDWPGSIEVECLDTGLDTPTGGRVLRAAKRIGAEPFNVTYADGVADVDLRGLLDFHGSGRSLGTMTVVRPRLPFGLAEVDAAGRVRGFAEKPPLDGWVNGGFFRFEPAVIEYLEPDSVLERAPLERLAADGELRAYRHRGFWQCLDTYKDAVLLNDLCDAGGPPWRAWARQPEPA